jgi:hypothetical protein
MVPLALQPKLAALHGDIESCVSSAHLSAAAASDARDRAPKDRRIIPARSRSLERAIGGGSSS